MSIPFVLFQVWYTCASGSVIGDVQFPLRVVAYFVLPDWSYMCDNDIALVDSFKKCASKMKMMGVS